MPGLGLSRPKNVPGSLQFAGGMKFTRYAWNGSQTASEDALAFTVGGDGRISVNSKGLTAKTREKLAEIEDALNSDSSL